MKILRGYLIVGFVALASLPIFPVRDCFCRGTSALATPLPQSEEKCPKCTAGVQPEWKFCQKCGAQLIRKTDTYRLSIYNDNSDRWQISGSIVLRGAVGSSGTNFGIIDRTAPTDLKSTWMGHRFAVLGVTPSKVTVEGNGWQIFSLGKGRGSAQVSGKLRLIFALVGRGKDSIEVNFTPMPGHRHKDLAVQALRVSLANSYLKLEQR